MHRYIFSVLDTETTGFYHKNNDRIVEISAVKIKEGQICEKEVFNTLVNPQRNIPPAATRIHKIVDDMVLDSPKFEDISNNLINFLSDVDYLIIHNAKFDLGFLESEMKRIGQSLQLPKVVCSVDLSRKLYPQYKYHNLNAIAKNMGLSIQKDQKRHRALGDVILTAEALLKFYEENSLIFLGTLEQIANKKFI